MYMKQMRYGLLLSAVGLVSACSNNVPKCSDPEAADLVLEITLDEIANSYGQARADELSLSLDAIRTTDENDKTGAFDCAAVIDNGEGTEFPITYTVEVTDDKRTYVTVFGL